MPKGRRQVVWAPRDACEPWHRQNALQVGVRVLGLDLRQHDHIPVRPRGEAELAPVFLVEHGRVIELRPASPTPGAPPIWGEQAGVGQLLGFLLALDVRTDHPWMPRSSHRLSVFGWMFGTRAITDSP